MTRIVSRIAGRLLTGPLAFFLAGMIDVAVLAAQLLARRNWRNRASDATSGGGEGSP